MTRQPIMPPPPVGPILRPSAPAGGFDEPTPTTRPSWGPPPPIRLARGTQQPPVGRPAELGELGSALAIEPPASRPSLSARVTAPELAVRLIETPRRWGRIERIRLDASVEVVQPPVAGVTADLEGATTPFVRTRISLIDATDGIPAVRRAIPWPAIGAGAAALAVLIVMAVAVSGGGSRAGAAPPPVAPVVTALPASPAPVIAADDDRPAAAAARSADGADLDVFGVEDPVAPAAAPDAPAVAGEPDLDVFGVVDPDPAAPAAEPAPIEMDVMDVARPAPAPRPAARPRRFGVLMVSAKPPCRILVDGRDTGLTTPQRDLRLAPGRHVVTLVNDEHDIRDRSTVTVPVGGAVKLIRDLTERML